jgi:hypothetical protein
MDVFLSHLDTGPLIYGLVIFIGLFSMWWKLTRGKFVSLSIEVVVFYLVFRLHGGTMSGGFAAAIAVLPSDATLDTPLQILEISPTAIKGFSGYVGTVARILNCLPFGVVTHVSLNPAIQQDVAIFSDPQLIEDGDYIAMVRSRRQEARELLLTEPDIAAMQAAGANNAKAPKGKNLMAAKRAPAAKSAQANARR